MISCLDCLSHIFTFRTEAAGNMQLVSRSKSKKQRYSKKKKQICIKYLNTDTSLNLHYYYLCVHTVSALEFYTLTVYEIFFSQTSDNNYFSNSIKNSLVHTDLREKNSE